MAPFRTRHQDQLSPLAATAEVHEAVDQMVRQFADPMAFYRELVQNSLDAGARSIEARIDWFPESPESDDGVLHASMLDDGSGMDQETLERCLLVLFRSSKDRDPSKIGKFGVGFFSVFAVQPEEVRIETGRSPAQPGLRLVLKRDYTYEVLQSSPRQGTLVELRVPMKRDRVTGFIDDSVAALERWCPHVAVALHVVAHSPTDDPAERRIDRPFELDAPVAVMQQDADGARYILGVAEDTVASFYNRGILLHASHEDALPGVTWKVDSPALHHTLSRDNVRRDAVFQRCVERARAVARGPLRERLVAALREHAHACAAARHHGRVDGQSARNYALLLSRAGGELFDLKAHEVTWPLAAPMLVDGRESATASFEMKRFLSPPRFFTLGPSALTAALARRGVPVVDLGAAGDGDRLTTLRSRFDEHYGTTSRWVADRYCLPNVTRADALATHEARLQEKVAALLGAVGVAGVTFASPEGAGSDRLFLTVSADAVRGGDVYAPHFVIDVEGDKPFAFGRGRVALLSRAHPRVVAAARAAREDAAFAALALARLVLLAAGELDDAADLSLYTQAVLG